MAAFGGGGGGGSGLPPPRGGDAPTRKGKFPRHRKRHFRLGRPESAGAGGFGGGGGGINPDAAGGSGGNGGFGGGGAAGGTVAGEGGVGGGAGDATGNGGGGLGAGGAIFVQEGGTLTVVGNFTVNGNSVVAGTGGGPGSAIGSGIFLQGNNTLTLQPGSGETQTIADVITDQTGSFGSGGSGNLVVNGAGTLVLSGVDTYTGTTTVASGTLAVTGSIANSITTVGNGGTLAGSGTVGGLVAQSGGTVAPGALTPFTTLNVSGNASFAAGSIFLVNINAAGQNDKLLVTGTATLSGGTVQVIAANGTYSPTTRFTLLTAQGGVSGAFAQLTTTSNLAFLKPVLSEDADDVFLSFTVDGGRDLWLGRRDARPKVDGRGLAGARLRAGLQRGHRPERRRRSSGVQRALGRDPRNRCLGGLRGRPPAARGDPRSVEPAARDASSGRRVDDDGRLRGRSSNPQGPSRRAHRCAHVPASPLRSLGPGLR